jgi:hypothetical protein
MGATVGKVLIACCWQKQSSYKKDIAVMQLEGGFFPAVLKPLIGPFKGPMSNEMSPVVEVAPMKGVVMTPALFTVKSNLVM